MNLAVRRGSQFDFTKRLNCKFTVPFEAHLSVVGAPGFQRDREVSLLALCGEHNALGYKGVNKQPITPARVGHCFRIEI